MRYLGRKLKPTKGVLILLKNINYVPKFLFTVLRSKTLIDYKLFKNGFSFYPSHIVWEITNRCNLHCKMCWLWSSHGIGKSFLKQELTLKDVKKSIDRVSFFKPVIYFTGGEPFIRDDMTEIIKYVKNKGLICTVATNGTLITPNVAKDIVNSKLDVIGFSLDGPQDIHNKIRGAEIFEKVIENIKLIIKERRKKTFPIVKIGTTISDLNYDKLLEVVSIAEELGIDELQFQHLWFTDKNHAIPHKKVINQLFGIITSGIDGYVVNNSKVDSNILYKQIREISKLKSAVDISFYPSLNHKNELKKFYTNPSFIFKDKCVNSWFSVTIKPNGDIIPCPDYYIPEYVIGNIKCPSFSNIWNNQKAKLFRKILKKHGCFPGCTRCCGLFGGG